ncbi:Antirestriction protein [Phaeobacter sp. CECT 5382]|uniref:antirestriction protein ArdA n=1 Tax=Phaeobacter sp. CECT 5382 TaxID=1712645 RepID=UPI0006DA570A|nr:antirestriction protein ArdA [Phaeobacter sp. CECT 5382]CUH89890.1 Antirestriction protein [Phaeobacter sp. CECT 5382]
MPQLHAQPYDLGATGFYFESLEEYASKADKNHNAYGDPVEEYEIQFIDGDDIDCALAKAWGINQANIGGYFTACDEWEEYQKKIFIIAVGEIGYGYNPEDVHPEEFDVDMYHVDSMKELAEQMVDEGLFGDIPEHLERYIDMDAIARDLAYDYTETEIAGETLIYRAA